jgi:hypothetical protein
MTFTGTMHDGALVFTAPVTIPQGTEVRVEAPAVPQAVPEKERELTFAERYAFFIGKVEGLPEDAATNVDHYLYGHPKRA